MLADITVAFFYDKLSYDNPILSGAEGGKAGRNKVSWDGRNDAGGQVGNGVYVGTIVSGGKLLAKFKLAIKH